jgi:molybdate transport system ATP-binding protein
MSRPQIMPDASAKPETLTLPAGKSRAPEGEIKDRTLQAHFCKRFLSAEHEFSLQVDFDAEPGFTILFGPSGAGKTTLLDCLAGLAAPDAGRIAVNNRVLFNAEAGLSLPVAKRQIGYVFQDLALFPHLNVQQNVAYGLAHLSRRTRQRRALAALDALRIAHLSQRQPAQISGGERQRVALARALVTDPSVLLLDEPLAALDARTKSGLLDDLRQWNQAHRIPILYVTHSREEVCGLGERVLLLDNGQIIAQGTPHQVLSAPQQETVAQLAGFENIFDANVEALHAERGTMTCRLATGGTDSMQQAKLELETPLVRAEVGRQLRVGIRAGDILLAVVPPVGLSARNIIAGRLVSLEQRDVIVRARIDCGVKMEVHLTLAARDALQLHPGRDVWLVIKTHSCHLMAN